MSITREQYLVGAEAIGTTYGKDFNYNPNINVDQFVNFLLGQAPIITSDMEHALADQITGVTSVIGKDYNSQFVGQKVVTHYPQMVAFWIGQRPTTSVCDQKLQAKLDQIKAIIESN